MKVLWIGLTDLRRMFRVRTNIFFVFVFPMVLILVLGATFGGSFTPRLGVVSTGSGPLGAVLLRQLGQTPHLKVVTVPDSAALLTQVERGNLAAGVIVPPGYDGAVRAGRTVDLRYLARPDQSSQQLGEAVRGVVARPAALLGTSSRRSVSRCCWASASAPSAAAWYRSRSSLRRCAGSPTSPRKPGATTPSPGSSAMARPSPVSCRSSASWRPMPPCC